MPRSIKRSNTPLLLRILLILIWCLTLPSNQEAVLPAQRKTEKNKPLWKDPSWMRAALGKTDSVSSFAREPRTNILDKGQYIWIGSSTEDLKRVMHRFMENQIYGFYVDGKLKGGLKSSDRRHYRMYDLMLGWQKGEIRAIGNGDDTHEKNPEFYGIVNYNARMRPYKFKLPSTKKKLNQWLESAIAHEDEEAALKISRYALAFKDPGSKKAPGHSASRESS